MDYRRKTSRNDEYSQDSPTYSTLFIVSGKNTKEDEMRNAFDKFGTIEDLRMPRDHNSGQPKGITFIKFSKTSEAARALEEMNKKIIPGCTRPLKVMVAANRSEIQTDDDDDEKYKRLFITVPYKVTEEELRETFSAYGSVDNVRMQRDRNTGQSKGFAYVTFRKFSEAANAFENCEQSYRAIFALPRGYHRRQETSFESTINSLATTSSIQNPLLEAMATRPEGYKRIMFMCSPYLMLRHVERFFDIVPGMIRCEYYVDRMNNCGKGTVLYANPISAAYAVEKLNKFEYPPGVNMFVKPDNSNFEHEQDFNYIPNVTKNLKTTIASSTNSSSPDIAQLAKAIAEASKLIKKATGSVTDDIELDKNDLNYCSVKLPEPKPLADIDSPVAKRCFLVCKPQPPPLTVLRDVFCRFGNLINVYTLPGKTVGYARYASTAAAEEAMKVLHGAEICGIRIKVLEADDEAPPKKVKYNH